MINLLMGLMMTKVMKGSTRFLPGTSKYWRNRVLREDVGYRR